MVRTKKTYPPEFRLAGFLFHVSKATNLVIDEGSLQRQDELDMEWQGLGSWFQSSHYLAV